MKYAAHVAEKLRVGLSVDSLELPMWIGALVRRLTECDYASVELIILRAADATRLTRRTDGWRQLVFRLYSRLDEKLFAEEPDAQAPASIAALVADVPKIEVTLVGHGDADHIDEHSVEQIKQHGLDVIVHLGDRALDGGVLRAAKHGVWAYQHGDDEVGYGGPAGCHEVMTHRGVTGTVLRVLGEDPLTGEVVYRSFSQTDNHSIHRNRNQLCWKAVSFVPRALARLHAWGAPRFFQHVAEQTPQPNVSSSRLHNAAGPENGEMLRLIVGHLARFAADKLLQLMYREQWILMFRLGEGLSASLRRFQHIVPPGDRYYADPFVVQREDKYFVFVEDFRYARNRGHISVFEMDDRGNHSEPVPIIEQPYHLSYPFVFQHAGSYFMIPESGANRCISIYRCIEFPYRWEFEMNLMEDVAAVDTTVLHRDNRYWLFTNIVETPGASSLDELHVFHAQELLTNRWISHPLNPVVSDVRRARPAGAIFEHEGRFVRPSQNCAKLYGYGMKLNAITDLGEDSYEEKEIVSIEPNWDKRLIATHTFNHAGNLTVADGVLRTRRWFNRLRTSSHDRNV